MSKRYIGIDNGVTGTIAIVNDKGCLLWTRTPTFRQISHKKTKSYITRIDTPKLEAALKAVVPAGEQNCMVVMEQPYANGLHFHTSISAARSFEATLIVIERLKYPHMCVPSSDWQKVMLPKGARGSELKVIAADIATKLFPKVDTYGDADALLMAEWARRKKL